MPRKTMELRFPGAGVVRRPGLYDTAHWKPPFPTPWALNVRLEATLANRLRGGSFTGIAAGERPDLVYRDRTLTFSSAVITASRKGDPEDTTLSSDVSDAMRPTIFTLSEDDAISEDVVALVPYKDRTLLGFTANEIWLQTGDPLEGPRINISRDVGIIGPDAWAKHHDTVYFLSPHGLYFIGANGNGLKALSEDSIPEDLTGVSDSACTLTYNHADRGVYVHLTDDGDWFYDTERDGFWPYDTGETDSHVLLGPLKLGQANHFGRVLHLHGNIAASSADVTWRIVIGDTAEEAAANGKAAILAAVAGSDYSSYVSAEGDWSAGLAHRDYPKTRAIWCCLWLHSEGDWAFETASMVVQWSGIWR